ncbi:hypothetical protein PVAP13_8NG120400 [Panicum virgatum]|uniref:Uncharacterized protein n=1 Tax=Panicum virgatum TaxID=38727 RepID=A0A8T0P8E3_PANVG|nr:hypothetical protein PVAP13_8NG120400 [Panicum virgatum]KAG2558053.1 hypothetical protein PVAP13_8NG120400 [Panicum virgatum]
MPVTDPKCAADGCLLLQYVEEIPIRSGWYGRRESKKCAPEPVIFVPPSPAAADHGLMIVIMCSVKGWGMWHAATGASISPRTCPCGTSGFTFVGRPALDGALKARAAGDGCTSDSLSVTAKC